MNGQQAPTQPQMPDPSKYDYYLDGAGHSYRFNKGANPATVMKATPPGFMPITGSPQGIADLMSKKSASTGKPTLVGTPEKPSPARTDPRRYAPGAQPPTAQAQAAPPKPPATTAPTGPPAPYAGVGQWLTSPEVSRQATVGGTQFMKGIGEGLASDLAMVSGLPGVRSVLPKGSKDYLTELARPNNDIQEYGKIAEQSLEFMVPGLDAEALVSKFGKLAPIAKMVQNMNPERVNTLMKAGAGAVNVGQEALKTGGIEAMHGGSFTEGAKTGAYAGVANLGLSAISSTMLKGILGVGDRYGGDTRSLIRQTEGLKKSTIAKNVDKTLTAHNAETMKLLHAYRNEAVPASQMLRDLDTTVYRKLNTDEMPTLKAFRKTITDHAQMMGVPTQTAHTGFWAMRPTAAESLRVKLGRQLDYELEHPTTINNELTRVYNDFEKLIGSKVPGYNQMAHTRKGLETIGWGLREHPPGLMGYHQAIKRGALGMAVPIFIGAGLGREAGKATAEQLGLTGGAALTPQIAGGFLGAAGAYKLGLPAMTGMARGLSNPMLPRAAAGAYLSFEDQERQRKKAPVMTTE